MVALTQQRPSSFAATAQAPARLTARDRRASRWFMVLMLAVCFEGLGRKFLPFLPATAFYFAKDVVLIFGLISFGIKPTVAGKVRRLLGAWKAAYPIAVLWSILECFNPENRSALMAVIGLRAYWLWWIAPLVVASALDSPRTRATAIRHLAWMTIFICLFASYQFASPASDSINTYALYEDQVMKKVAVVASTGRARVSSTFSYVSGFTIFCQTIPLIFLALGLGTPEKKTRTLFFAATAACLAALPMSGSRGPLLLLGSGMFLIAYGAGLFGTRLGRRLMVAMFVGALFAATFSYDAIQGVLDRFNTSSSETSSRLAEAFLFLPPVSFATFDYPMFGVGTGMDQNATHALKLNHPIYWEEAEYGKILVEQGPAGWLLLWFCRLGLVAALWRLGRQFRKAHLGAIQGVCWALMVHALTGKLFFDHISQSLLLSGIGLLLAVGNQAQPTPRPTQPQRHAPRGPAVIIAP